jgi:dihydroxyacetone kinase-like predicted kinase
MSSPQTLSAKGLRAVITTYGELLHSYRDVINRLNVYPVPDGDTGTNMALTIESVVVALRDLDENAPLGEVAQAIAKGSLMGARGNSGVILSQLLRGLVADFPSAVRSARPSWPTPCTTRTSSRARPWCDRSRAPS